MALTELPPLTAPTPFVDDPEIRADIAKFRTMLDVNLEQYIEQQSKS